MGEDSTFELQMGNKTRVEKETREREREKRHTDFNATFMLNGDASFNRFRVVVYHGSFVPADSVS